MGTLLSCGEAIVPGYVHRYARVLLKVSFTSWGTGGVKTIWTWILAFREPQKNSEKVESSTLTVWGIGF